MPTVRIHRYRAVIGDRRNKGHHFGCVEPGDIIFRKPESLRQLSFQRFDITEVRFHRILQSPEILIGREIAHLHGHQPVGIRQRAEVEHL